jgi:hypothetical protein
MTHDRLVFGVTIDQIDELSSLLQTITANGDAMTFCDTGYLQPLSVSTLGAPSSTRRLPCGKFSIRSTSRDLNPNRNRASAPHVRVTGPAPLARMVGKAVLSSEPQRL